LVLNIEVGEADTLFGEFVNLRGRNGAALNAYVPPTSVVYEDVDNVRFYFLLVILRMDDRCRHDEDCGKHNECRSDTLHVYPLNGMLNCV
jgi:hypothetical protein